MNTTVLSLIFFLSIESFLELSTDTLKLVIYESKESLKLVISMSCL